MEIELPASLGGKTPIESLLNAKRQELLKKFTRNRKSAYAYCVYLNNELYSRFRDNDARQRHLASRIFKVASYQADVKLIYHKNPPDVLIDWKNQSKNNYNYLYK